MLTYYDNDKISLVRHLPTLSVFIKDGRIKTDISRVGLVAERLAKWIGGSP